MLSRNKNENNSSLTAFSDQSITSNCAVSEVDNKREILETSSRRIVTTNPQNLSSNKVTHDNLNNNKNILAKSNRTQNNKLVVSFDSDSNESGDNDIVNDFDLVSAFSNYRTPTTPTTTTFKPIIVQPSNSNNPTETFNILSPILNVTNQMTEVSYKHLSPSVISNSNSNKGKPLESTMKTNTNSPNHLRQHNNANMVAASAPNTPEALRKQQLLLRHRASDAAVSNANAQLNNTIAPTMLPGKKEKMEFNQMMMKMNYEKECSSRPLSYHGKSASTDTSYPNSLMSSPVNKRHVVSNSGMGIGSPVTRNARKEALLLNRRSMPSPFLENRLREKFDISDLDTNLPRIDLEAIENHLRLAREEERKRRTDREEIRRRLALESDDINDKNGMGGRKPSLHSRLQSSMNLQICFMNETASDSECSPGSDSEIKHSQPPASLPCQASANKVQSSGNVMEGNEVSGGGPAEDFYTRQARLQADARRALSQAKDLARLQMTQEKERRLQSPITEMVRNSLQKVGVSLPSERRRVSRQLLTELNVAQLQVIVNDLHSHIEVLNETLVSMLLERDDLHMEQDSMLVDIEDLTRYLAAKDNSPHQSLPLIQPSKSLLGKK